MRKARQRPVRGRLLSLGLGLIFAALAAGAARADPCTAPLPQHGEPFHGPVMWVIDGDSLCVHQPGGLMIEVRLVDFDAPEISEPGGDAAWFDLVGLTLTRELACTPLARSYDRVVARCTLDGDPVGVLLKAAGHPEGGRGHPASPN